MLNFSNLKKKTNFGTHPRYTQCLIFHNIMICKDMNCINPRFQMISCIGLELVKTYIKLFLGKGGDALGISKHFVNAHLGLD